MTLLRNIVDSGTDEDRPPSLLSQEEQKYLVEYDYQNSYGMLDFLGNILPHIDDEDHLEFLRKLKEKVVRSKQLAKHDDCIKNWDIDDFLCANNLNIWHSKDHHNLFMHIFHPYVCIHDIYIVGEEFFLDCIPTVHQKLIDILESHIRVVFQSIRYYLEEERPDEVGNWTPPIAPQGSKYILRELLAQAKKVSYQEGYDAGYDAGYDKGWDAGYDVGRASVLQEQKTSRKFRNNILVTLGLSALCAWGLAERTGTNKRGMQQIREIGVVFLETGKKIGEILSNTSPMDQPDGPPSREPNLEVIEIYTPNTP